DPELGGSGPGGVGAVLFDEFHERHLAGDLGLALALDVQSGLREDLRIVLMSATLDGERLAHWLDAPRLASEGRGFPVRVAHFPARRAGGREEPLEAQVRRAVEHALAAHPGDVLVFLPGQREIAKAQAALEVATNRHSRESGDPATFAPEAGAGSGARTLDSRFRGNDDGEGSGDRADTAAS